MSSSRDVYSLPCVAPGMSTQSIAPVAGSAVSGSQRCHCSARSGTPAHDPGNARVLTSYSGDHHQASVGGLRFASAGGAVTTALAAVADEAPPMALFAVTMTRSVW